MKKKFVLATALACVAATGLTSCGAGGDGFNDTTGITVENGTIGFILPGMVGGEMKAFMARWEKLAAEYNVKVIFKNFSGTDPSTYGKMANELIALGANAIICNFEMDGKETVIEKCISERVYVAYSGSTVSEETFDEFKQYPYFLGQISPTPAQEEAEAYDMTKYYLDMYYGTNKVAVPEGTSDKFAIWPVDFHGIDMAHQMTYRWKGIKSALKEYGCTIKGDEDSDSFKWSAEYTTDSPLKDKVLIMGNNLMDPTLNARCLADLNSNPNTVIISGSADYLLAKFASQGAFTKGTRFATIDSLNENYNKYYNADEASEVAAFKVAHDPYIIGKYIAVNEPVLALCAKAFAGEPIRTSNGEAISINQKFWRAKTKDEYKHASELSRSFEFGKDVLDGIKTPEALQALLDKTTLEYVSGLNK